METDRQPGGDRIDDARVGEPGRSERDGDLVALEGLEAEFTDLEAELERVERSRGAGATGTDH